MMMHAIIRNGQPETVAGAFTDNAGVKHPANVLTLWSEAELAAIDVYPVTDGSVPDGHVTTGSALVWDANAATVTRVFTSEPAPPPGMDDYRNAIQAHIDTTAGQRDYGSAVSAASYATSKNAKWKSEAETFVDWRDSVWTYVYEQLALVQAGQRTQPTVAEFIAELPAIVWPA
jgi:hypothetical protein